MSGRPRGEGRRATTSENVNRACCSPSAPPPQADPGAAPKSAIARHDAHVRLLRRWATEGISPDRLGARLRHWREAGRGWTREQLAAETGLPIATIARQERGEQPIPLPDYRRYVQALAVDPITVRRALEPFERIAAGLRLAEAIDRRRRPAR